MTKIVGFGEGQYVLTLVSFTNPRGSGIEPQHDKSQESYF